MRGTRTKSEHGEIDVAATNRIPKLGELVTLTRTMIERRPGFKLVSETGWFSLHATRRAALDFAQQCGFHVRASTLVPPAKVKA